jgi:hypothetical protein
MLTVPTENKELISFTSDLVETCRISVGARMAYCRLMNQLAETGRYNGTKSLLNLLNRHLARTAAHLFSPVELKFALDYERPVPKRFMEMGKFAAKSLTRLWERNSTDTLFGRGVFESLKYGACLTKQWPETTGFDEDIVYNAKLVMPWQFGVFNEAENDISKQYALCETVTLTKPEVWRRIWHLPDAKKLYDRICSHASKGIDSGDPQSFFHQVLSTSQLQTGVEQATRQMPGGTVQFNSDPNYSLMGPVLGTEAVQMHELWVKDQEFNDYVTIQMVAPDVIIAPRHKKANLLGTDLRTQPYRLIQPNEVTGWFWGRSELVDLVEPQALLSMWLDDLQRLFGLQIDKLIGFMGEAGLTDEMYGQMRAAGFFNLPQGSTMQDVTPKIPPEALPLIKWLIDMIHALGEFPNIMQGQGEPGVRSMAHASTLLKTASPTMRDRALLVERQCAVSADLTLTLMEAKEDEFYWTKADTPTEAEETKFTISALPEWWRVTVDSHSSSPIFADEFAQLIMAAFKMGIVDSEYVLDNLPFPEKEMAKVNAKEREKSKQALIQKLMQEDPETATKVLGKSMSGGKR